MSNLKDVGLIDIQYPFYRNRSAVYGEYLRVHNGPTSGTLHTDECDKKYEEAYGTDALDYPERHRSCSCPTVFIPNDEWVVPPSVNEIKAVYALAREDTSAVLRVETDVCDSVYTFSFEGKISNYTNLCLDISGASRLKLKLIKGTIIYPMMSVACSRFKKDEK